MRGDHHERINRCYTQLTEGVNANLIAGHLYEAEVLNQKDLNELKAIRVPHERMERLLDILIGKPKKKKNSPCPYSALIDALKKEQYDTIVETLEKVETTADPEKHTEANPDEYNDSVREILLDNYVVTTLKTEIALVDIQNLLSKKIKVPGGFSWKKEKLTEFVCKTFRIEHYKKTKFKRQPVYFKNLVEKAKIQEAVPPKGKQGELEAGAVGGVPEEKILSEGPTDQQQTSSESEKAIQDMNCDELRVFLTQMFQQKGITTVLPKALLEHQITGEVLLTMNESDLKLIASPREFAAIRTLSLFIAKISETSQAPKEKIYEKLRKFGLHVDHTIKYIKGNQTDAAEGQRDMKLTRVCNFHNLESIDEEQLHDMALEVIKFASACINEGKNGTIYFGIKLSERNIGAGEIVGVHMAGDDQDKLKGILDDYLDRCFHQEDFEIVKKTVKPPEFVKVEGAEDNLWVTEIDIVPSSNILSNCIDPLKTKAKLLQIVSRKDRSQCVYFRFSRDSIPEIVKPFELDEFRKYVRDCKKKRQHDEKALVVPRRPNLRKKMLNQLTGGRDKLEDHIYPFVILSPVDTHMDEQYVGQHFQFMKHLQAEAVFDFDPTGSSKGIFHDMDMNQNLGMRALTLDNFDSATHSSSKDHKNFIGSIRTGDRIPWIFCNGYKAKNIPELNPYDWNRQKRSAFQECIKVFDSAVCRKRVVIIILLLSKNYEIMLAGCEEILTRYPDQWVLFAESENIANQWKESMLSRDKVRKQDIDTRCIIGMPWSNFNEELMQLFTCNEVHVCKLPRSNGTFAEIRAKKVTDWNCVDVLSASDPQVDGDEHSVRQKVEHDFYAGCPVDWLNFYFGNQVLRRSFHDELRSKVASALQESEEEELVTSVVLWHQPGAGGTTSAKQVLWDMRKEYRCCVIKYVTDETCDQLMDIRSYSDDSPKPLLILIDHEDEEKCKQLMFSLEERCRLLHRQSAHADSVYATVLLCIRRSNLPRQMKARWSNVPHSLDDEELKWFSAKDTTLKAQHKGGDIDPKYLFSFNILKTNFRIDCIDRVVTEFVKDIDSEPEKKLLTAIALLNTYYYMSVPISCFDHLFADKHSLAENSETPSQRSLSWEADLSQLTKVLLNMSYGVPRETLRVMNVRLAQRLLIQLKTSTKRKESVIMREIMQYPAFHSETTDDGKSLKDIIGNVMKVREVKENGDREFFSRFITTIKDQEGEKVAVDLLIELFKKNDDAFTAQQIARFFITMKDWKTAEQYAETAVRLVPSTSYLWDTYGQVYKKQLYELTISSKRSIGASGAFEEKEIHKMIRLTQDAVYCFKKEQEADEKSANRENYLAGYLGELKSEIMLLHALAKCSHFKDRSEFCKYLVDSRLTLPALSFLQQDEIHFLKELEKTCKETMRRLDEEFHQVKNTVSSKFIAPSLEQKMSRDVLFGLMVSFYDYFCDSIDEDKLHPEERRVYAYKKAVALGAMSLSHLLHKRKEKNYKDLMKIFELLHPVVQQSPKFDYVIAMLNTVSALIVDGILPPGLTFPSILEWCSELYWSYQCSEPSRHYLEPFLFFFMYNFPTEERSGYDLCSVNDLTGAQKKWKEAFRNKYPLHEKEVIPHTRERTLFFLGKGGLGSDIVHQDSLPMKDDTLHSRMDKWHQPAMKARLRSFRGTLENGGEKITLYIEKGENGESGFPIEICTAYTVKNRRLWQTEVYFFLGFSFAGPKAYAITKDPPNVGEDNMQEAPNRQELPPSSEQATSSREQTAQKLSLGPLMSEKLKLEKVLRSKRSHLQDKKSTTPEIQSIERKLRQINDKVNLLLR